MKNSILILMVALIVAASGFAYNQYRVGQTLLSSKQLFQNPTLSPTKPSSSSSPTATSPAEDPSESIRTDLAKKYSLPPEKVKVDVRKLTDTHISGMVSVDGGGGWFLGAKQQGSWHLVEDGNGIVSCEKVLPYKFPSTMVPSCVNAQGQIINNP